MRRAEALVNEVYKVTLSSIVMAKAPITMEEVSIAKTQREIVTLLERETVGIVEPKRVPPGVLNFRARQAVTNLEDG